MKLSELKTELNGLAELRFIHSSGNAVAPHFHLTEAGLTTKTFIDCGGTLREEKVVNFQLYLANDVDHRLSPSTFSKIIAISEKALKLEDLEVEIEYQTDTIGRYALDFSGKEFRLVPKYTDCLAKDSCGTGAKEKKNLAELAAVSKTCCSPESGCCN